MAEDLSPVERIDGQKIHKSPPEIDPFELVDRIKTQIPWVPLLKMDQRAGQQPFSRCHNRTNPAPGPARTG